MTQILLVAFGGALGASLRHLVNMAAIRLFGPGFPWGTFGANLIGSFVMGLFIGVMMTRYAHQTELRLFVATGLLGGFTTFSAFSLDVVMLWERGALLEVLLYVAGSVVLAIMSLMAGLFLARHVLAS